MAPLQTNKSMLVPEYQRQQDSQGKIEDQEGLHRV